MQSRRWARVASGIAVAGLALGTAPVAGATTTPPPLRQTVELPDPVPGWTTYATDEGPASNHVVLHLRFYLTGRDRAATVREATAVSDPTSTSYGRYLTPARFVARYGPTRAQVDTVERWARRAGLRVTAHDSHYVAVTGPAPAVSKALDTTIDAYSQNGESGYAPTKGISMPAPAGLDVTTVVGLDSIGPTSAAPAVRHQLSQASAKPPVCSQWWGQHHTTVPKIDGRTTLPDAVCGYTPQQLRSAYGVTPTDGKGATIAVVLDGHLAPMETDADRFFRAHHLAGFAKGQFSQNFGPGFTASCGRQGADLPEEPLDVETAHIIAPAAKVVYVAVNCSQNEPLQQQDFLDAETRIVDHHLADVETDSFSTTEAIWTPAMATAWTQLFEQGAIEGIGFDFDSGDGGPDTGAGLNGGNAVQFPASDPWATAVGGTTMEIGERGRVLRTLGWGDTGDQINSAGTGYLQPAPGSFEQGSTGGRSVLFGEPAYQRPVVPSALARPSGTRAANRVVPDIAADASPMSGWLIGYQAGIGAPYTQVTEGGTSGASPTIAGLEADAQSVSGRALGFVNPLLYALHSGAGIERVKPASPPALAAASNCYNDPTAPVAPCVITLGADSTLRTTGRFDEVTGLGAPTLEFVAALARG
jgi:subtilase family serine protease